MICEWDTAQATTFTNWGGNSTYMYNKLATTYVKDEMIHFGVSNAEPITRIYRQYKNNPNLTFLENDYSAKYAVLNTTTAHHRSDRSDIMCVMISTNVLTFGKWMLVDCYKKVKNYMIACEKKIDIKYYIQTLDFATYECAHDAIYINTSQGSNFCYQFLSSSNQQNCISTPSISTDIHVYNNAREANMYLSKWARGRTRYIRYYTSTSTNESLCFKRLCESCADHDIHDWLGEVACFANSTEYWLCRTHVAPVSKDCQTGRFQCHDGTCILLQYHCDDAVDCPDHSDEMACDDVCSDGFQCFISCPKPQCFCNKNYMQIGNKCVPLYRWYKHWTHTQIDDYVGSPRRLLMGEVSVCPEGWSKCTPETLLSTCYPNEKICVFERIITGEALYCRNTEHLMFCENHKCPSMFACENTYCIPFHMVCDGVSDCPDGRDEAGERCHNLSCPGMLRCRHDDLCVHHHAFCDGVVHCITSHDDEELCQYLQCHNGCHCIGPTMFCDQMSFINQTLLDSFHGLFIETYSGAFNFEHTLLNLNVLNLTHVHLTSATLHDSINRQTNLVSLTLMNNSLNILHPFAFSELSRLVNLTIQLNALHHLHPYAFHVLHSIQYLNLNNLDIRVIGSCCFCYMTNLIAINLSSNAIAEITVEMFDISKHYSSIDLSNNTFQYFDPNYKIINVEVVFIDQHELCCYLKHLCPVCKSLNSDMLCAFIFPTNAVASLVSIYVIILLIMNTYVIIVHCSTKVSHFTLIQNLALADLTYVIYLTLLVFAHFLYADQLPLHHREWISSLRCDIATFTLVTFMLQSKCSSILVEINYVFAIKYALERKSLKRNVIIRLLASLWISNCLLAGLFTHYTTRSDVRCTPFTSKNKGATIVKILYSLFLCIRGIFMITCYYIVLSEVRKSAAKVNQTNKVVKRRFQTVLTKAVFTVTAFAISAISMIVSMFWQPVSKSSIVELILLVVLIPLDVVVNPLVYV